ncbi:MAG: hypothetical protein K0S78_325 [Thermomicrobiales bacterium]|jgi:hypothetical protein|nr:hypothetical protein [Thermomicrobiales bacterium]
MNLDRSPPRAAHPPDAGAATANIAFRYDRPPA